MLRIIIRIIMATVLALLAGGGLAWALGLVIQRDNLIVGVVAVVFSIVFGVSVFLNSADE